jgi:hypothetical protein
MTRSHRWLISCALGLLAAACDIQSEAESPPDPSAGQELKRGARTAALDPCSSVCKKKDDCNSGCSEGNPPVATICSASNAGRQMCSEDPFPGPFPDPSPSPPPGDGQLNPCPDWTCRDEGPAKLIGQRKTQFREVVDPDTKPPETELIDYTVNFFARPQWTAPSDQVPNCNRTRCCDRIFHTHERGAPNSVWGDSYDTIGGQCRKF